MDTGHFAERQFAETQFGEREGQFAENYSANCPCVNFRQIVPASIFDKLSLRQFSANCFRQIVPYPKLLKNFCRSKCVDASGKSPIVHLHRK